MLFECEGRAEKSVGRTTYVRPLSELTRQWRWVLRFFELSADLGLCGPCAYTVAITSAEQAARWRLFCSLAGALDANKLGLSAFAI